MATTAAVLALAVLDMLSPALVGVSIYLVLARPRRVLPFLLAYLGTVALSYFALGVVLMFGAEALLSTLDPDALRWVQAAAGFVLFVGSWFIPDRKPDREPGAVRELTMRTMVALGLGTFVFEFYTAIPYFAAIGLMSAAQLEPSAWLTLLGIYAALMVLPGIAIHAISKAMGARVQQRLERWRNALSSGSRNTLRWVVGIVGVVLLLGALPSEIAITFG